MKDFAYFVQLEYALSYASQLSQFILIWKNLISAGKADYACIKLFKIRTYLMPH